MLDNADKAIKCPTCKARFTKNSNLNRHIGIFGGKCEEVKVDKIKPDAFRT